MNSPRPRWISPNPRSAPKTSRCFFCDGSHLVKNCPKKGKLNAIDVEEGSEEDSPTQVAPLRIMIAINSVGSSESGSLIFVLFFVNERKLLGLVDIKATHTVVS